MLKLRRRQPSPLIPGPSTWVGPRLSPLPYFLIGSITYYWVGGTGTWDNASTAHWATASGGGVGAGPPTINDNVIIDANSGSGTITAAATAVCNNLTVTWTAAKTNVLSFAGNFAPAGLVSITANSAINRLLVQSSVVGTQRTFTTGIAPVLANVDFMDIVAAGAGGTWAGTSMGDCLGNSGITFDASVQQTATGTASFTWSTHGWTTRVPLPQDDVVINNAFVAGRTITMDMPRMGRSISFAGVSGTPAWSVNIAAMYFGSLTLSASMTRTLLGTISCMARSSVTLTNAGVLWTGAFTLAAPGTLTMQDAYTGNFGSLGASMGSFIANNFNMTAPAFNFVGVSTGRNLSMGSGTWTATGTAGVWNINTTGGMTFDAGTSTLKFTDSSGAIKTFTGFGLAYNNLWFTGGGTGVLFISGASNNSFNEFKADPGMVVEWTSGQTQTAATWTVSGQAPTGSDVKFAQEFGNVQVNFSTPDSVATSPTTNLLIRVCSALASATPAAENKFLGKWNAAGNQKGYAFDIQPSGKLRISLSADGLAQILTDSTVAVGASALWFAVAITADNGAGGFDAKFYTSTDPVTTAPTAVTWTQLGTTVTTAGVTSIFDNTQTLEIGSFSGGSSPLTGRIYRTTVSASNVLTAASDVDFNPNNYTTGLSFTSATGELWTLAGNALISATNLVGFGSNTGSNATIAKSGGGTLDATYLSLARSTASPANTFYAGIAAGDSLDQGNNVNWSFLSRVVNTASSLLAQAAVVAAVGISLSTGTGALLDSASSASGSGASGSAATGSLADSASSIAGAGTSKSTATGALVDSVSSIAALGASGSASTGVLISAASQIAAVGEIILPLLPAIATPIDAETFYPDEMVGAVFYPIGLIGVVYHPAAITGVVQ